MSEKESAPVPSRQIIPTLIRDIQNNLQPIGEIHKFLGVRFHKAQIYGLIVDIKIKPNFVKIVLDDATGQIVTYLFIPTNYKELKEKESTYENKRTSLTKEESFQRVIQQSQSLLGTRATITGKPRRGDKKYNNFFNRHDYNLKDAEIIIDDGPDRTKEIEFRMKLVDFYTKQLNR